MPTHAGSPEQLRVLQKIFDALWLDLENSRSKYVFPWDAQANRERIAVLVVKHLNDRILDVAGLKRAILDEFDGSHNAEHGGMPDSRRLDPDQVKSAALLSFGRSRSAGRRSGERSA